ncbi:MAG: hypothetical protein R2747_10385 [Pyrinomonadaceae bacterium]
MPGDEPTPRKMFLPEEEEAYEDTQMFMLEFETDSGFKMTSLKLKGPKGTKDVYTDVSPQITILKRGRRYVVEAGISKSSIEEDDLPDEFKAFFGKKTKTGLIGPVKVRMPDKGDLFDGRVFLTYEQYLTKVKNRVNSAKFGIGTTLLKKLPEVIYNALIYYYRTHDKYGNPYFL